MLQNTAYVAKTVDLLDNLIGKALHDVSSDEEYWELVHEFFENRDNTVEDAGLLAHAFIMVVTGISALEFGDHTTYFHSVKRAYEYLLAELN